MSKDSIQNVLNKKYFWAFDVRLTLTDSTMLKKFQKYTIFYNPQWQLLLPLLVFVSCRYFFILSVEQHSNFQTFIDHFLYPLCFDGLIYLLAVAVLKLLFRLKRSLFILTIYYFISALIYFHHYKLYLAPPGTGAFAALFETTPQEAMEFTKLSDVWDLLGTFTLSILPLLSVFLLKKITVKNNQLLLTASLFFIIAFLIHIPYLNAPKDSLMPMDYSHQHRDVKNIYHYFEEYHNLIQLRDKRKDVTFHAKQEMPLTQAKQAHVLVIGESLARNHMSIYGYHRKTTPKLDTASDVLFYENVISPTTQTRSSIVRMLTPASGVNTDRFYEEGSIITAMRESGFQTYWISNQGRYGISDTETSVLADDAHASIFVNTDWNASSPDEKVIAPLKEVLSQEEKKIFIVIHLLGSHFDYSKRVPDTAKFKINDDFFNKKLSPGQMKRVDEYDASVKYADLIIDSLIQSLRQSHYDLSSLTYVSDHGEDVYDDANQLLGHGSPIVTRYTVEIPFILWQSKNFITQSIGEQKNQVGRFYNSGDLFHALVDLYNLQLKSYEAKRSIFSENYEENYPYIINSNGFKINYIDLKDEE